MDARLRWHDERADVTRAQMPDHLFSYGTLQLAKVQRALFGRTLEGTADLLTDHRQVTIGIRDPDAVATSGVVTHLALVPDPEAPPIRGKVYALTPTELSAADAYEGADYCRVAVRLASGLDAWVYVKA